MTRLQLAQAMFDLRGAPADAVPGAVETAATIDSALHPGQIAFLTGPSGAGKSTILRHLRGQLRARGHAAITVDPARLTETTQVIDLWPTPLVTTLSLLACSGLADAAILERRVQELSTGQRWRLALAHALYRSRRRGPHATLLIDEFGSMLDQVTARCLCRTLRRWVEPRPIRAVCASHDDSLLESLAPAVLIVQPLNAAAIVRIGPSASGCSA